MPTKPPRRGGCTPPGPKPSAAPSRVRSRSPAAAPGAPATPTPATAIAPAAAAAVIPDDSAAAKAAAGFGRVDDEGTVYVTEAAGERSVGQFPGSAPRRRSRCMSAASWTCRPRSRSSRRA
ncbi:hypothetical protein NKG05_27565 [Oerskovia sp. M15]